MPTLMMFLPEEHCQMAQQNASPLVGTDRRGSSQEACPQPARCWPRRAAAAADDLLTGGL